MKKILFLICFFTLICISLQAVEIENVKGNAKPMGMIPIKGSKDVKTQWTIKYSGYGFYIDVTCYDKNMKDIVATKFERDSDLSKDDSIEIRIKPNWEKEGKDDYYVYDVNVNNTQADALKQDYKKNFYFKSSVEKQFNCWIVHIYIPYVSMGINNNTYLKYDEYVDTSTFSCPIYTILNFGFNIERRYHPGKADEGRYIWQISKDGKMPWGIITQSPMFFVNELIDSSKVNLVALQKVGMKGNKFILYGPVIGKFDYTKAYTPQDWRYFKIYDYVTGKTYPAKDGVCLVDFDKGGNHKLIGIIYNNDNEVIGHSNLVEVKL